MVLDDASEHEIGCEIVRKVQKGMQQRLAQTNRSSRLMCA